MRWASNNGLSLILNSDLMRLRPKRWAFYPQNILHFFWSKFDKSTNRSSTEMWDNLRGFVCIHPAANMKLQEKLKYLFFIVLTKICKYVIIQTPYIYTYSNWYKIDKMLEYMLSFVCIDVQTLNHEFANIRQRIVHKIPNYIDNHSFARILWIPLKSLLSESNQGSCLSCIIL